MATHLRSLQALELALRSGSLKAAAAELAITPAAVGQRIRALEDYLGLDLLVRGRSGIRPTPALEKALPSLLAAFRELEAVTQILDFQRVEEVHVVADTDWEALWLRPRLPAFRQDHPNVLLCVNGVGDVPIRLGQVDCRVWFGAPLPGSERLFADYLLPVSSPENARRIARLPSAVRLDDFPLLHLGKYAGDPDALDWPGWVARFGHRTVAADRGLRYSQLVHALEAVRSDAGVLLCGAALLLDDLERGELTLPFPPREGAWSRHGYQLAVRPPAARRSAVQRFRAWLLREAGTTASRLAQLASGRSASRRRTPA